MPVSEVALTVAATMFVAVPASLMVVLARRRRRNQEFAVIPVANDRPPDSLPPIRTEMNRASQESARRFIEDLARGQ